MPYFYSEAEVEVDVDEFLSSCDSSEIAELIKALKQDGHLGDLNVDTGSVSIMQEFYNDSLLKLRNVYHQLSNDEIELIQNIAKKY